MQTENITNKVIEHSSKRKIDALISMGAGDLVDNTLKKLINYQKAIYRDNIKLIGQDLERFEKIYNMPSESFFKKFEAGSMGDEADYFEWSSMYENMLLFHKRIAELDSLDTV